MADAEAEGVREAGLEVDLYQYLTSSFVIANVLEFPRHSPRRC